MTERQRDEQIRDLKKNIANKCVDIDVLARDLRKATEPHKVLEGCRKIETVITEIRRSYHQIEDLECKVVEKDKR